jgi:hypothetical protein
MAHLHAGAGNHFDPAIVAAAQACEARFIAIAAAWID